MIVPVFLRWLETAPPPRRAEAAHALARAFLYSDVDDDVRDGMEAAIILLLDDASPDVRLSLADALAASPLAPRHAIIALAADQSEIASRVLSRSPVFTDGELVDLVAGVDDGLQTAIAARPALSTAVSAAIAEVGCVEACRRMATNPGAAMARISLRRVAERFGDDAELRESLFARDDLPVEIRQALVRRLSDTLGAMLSERSWVDADRARIVIGDACDRATIAMAAENESEDLVALCEHLRVTGQLTTSLLLRAVCAGNVGLFGAALAVLADVPEARIASLIAGGKAAALRAVYARAGLPMVAFEAFATAVASCREWDLKSVAPAARYRFARRLVDDVLARYEAITESEMTELTAMLRRFAADAARAAAREFAREARAAA